MPRIGQKCPRSGQQRNIHRDMEGGWEEEREGGKEGGKDGGGGMGGNNLFSLLFLRLERGPDSRSSGPESDDCELASESICTL